MWYFWILSKASEYAFSLLLESVVFVSLRHSCLLSHTLLLIGLCGAHGGKDNSNLLACIALLNHGSRETNNTIKSYMHVSVVKEVSDKNESGYEG